MDIEWCRNGDDLFVLQARPVTTGRRADPWNDSRSGDFLWTNTNVGEAIPDVMTPATWSMVQVFLTDAMATASIPPYVGYGRIGGHDLPERQRDEEPERDRRGERAAASGP